MTQLVQQPRARGTHALVIGVGDYPWLQGGSQQPVFPRNEGMGQLSSPPLSARAFAEWLMSPDGFRNTDRPLASLDLLISDPTTTQFTPPGGTSMQIQRANFVEIQAAVLNWFARGDHTDDQLIFYFCGHGISTGLMTTLLPEDYGRLQLPPQASLSLAIDFDSLYQGMDSCRARRQLFFIDACRVASGALIKSQGNRGVAIVPGQAQLTTPARDAPIYYATMPGN